MIKSHNCIDESKKKYIIHVRNKNCLKCDRFNHVINDCKNKKKLIKIKKKTFDFEKSSKN